MNRSSFWYGNVINWFLKRKLIDGCPLRHCDTWLIMSVALLWQLDTAMDIYTLSLQAFYQQISYQIRGPFHERLFTRNSNSIEISDCCNSVAGHTITATFCTCHDSTAVVPCTKFCSDSCVRIVVTVKRNLRRIWMAMEKTLVKWGPGHSYVITSAVWCWMWLFI